MQGWNDLRNGWTAPAAPTGGPRRLAAQCTTGLTVLAACLLTGCATWPDGVAQLSGQRHFRATIDTYPVVVVKVDGESTPLHQAIVQVEPGPRRIVVESTVPGGLGPPRQQEIQLLVAPCTRYYLVAEKSAPFLEKFTPRVDHQEPVPGCRKPTA